MCQRAAETAASVMAGIEPTLVQLLTFTGVAATPEGQAAIKAFNTAQQALASWQSGTSAQTAIEAINAFTSVFDVLPIPADLITLENIISAGVVTVIGILSANSPAPVTASAEDVTADPEHTQALYAHAVAASTEKKVNNLVPGFKRSLFHSAAHQYKSAWNKAVDHVSDVLGTQYKALHQN